MPTKKTAAKTTSAPKLVEKPSGKLYHLRLTANFQAPRRRRAGIEIPSGHDGITVRLSAEQEAEILADTVIKATPIKKEPETGTRPVYDQTGALDSFATPVAVVPEPTPETEATEQE